MVPSISTVTNLSDKNFIKINLEKAGTKALVDTGAQISCISEQFLKIAAPKLYKNYEKSPYSNVLGVGGEAHRILGTVRLILAIEGTHFQHKFHVFSKLQHPLILGDDFLYEYKGSIDIGNRKLFLRDQRVEIGLLQKSNHGIVKAGKSLTLKPQAETIVPVQIPNIENQTMLIEPIPSFSNSKPVIVAKVIVCVKQNKTVCRILNPTKRKVKIKPGTIIASAIPIHSEDIFDLIDENTTVSTISEGQTSNSSANTQNSDKFNSNNDTNAENKTFTRDEAISKAKELGINLDNTNLTADQKSKLLELIGRNRIAFAADNSELGCAKGFTHKIDTGNAKPQSSHPYRKSPKMAEIESKAIEDLYKNNIIQESFSLWQSPVVLVKKKSGDFRVAIDYRKLNSCTKQESSPLPRLDDVLDTIAASDAKIFTTLDLTSGFWQIPLDEDSREKSAFVTRSGKFEFLRMPFGLVNAPTTYQTMMNKVLRGLNWDILLVYMDDIIIFSSNFETHLEHLQKVFTRIVETNLTLNPKKCTFGAQKVLYLGHFISEKGVEVNHDKVKAISSFPQPKTVKQVREFLGMTNYYRKFIKGYSNISSPMYTLLKSDSKFEWTEECSQAFETLKLALINAPVLTHPNMKKPFILSTDASYNGVGYVLGQLDNAGNEHPIAYGGRSLRKHEKNYAITELECLALLEGIRKYHIYLADNKFTAYTDHKALLGISKTKPERKRLCRWAQELSSYKIDLKYRAGNKMGNADALSRREFENPDPKEIPDVVDEISVVTAHPETETPQRKLTEISLQYEYDSPEINFVTLSPISEPTITTIDINELAKEQQNDAELKDMYIYQLEGTLPDDSKSSKKILADEENYCVDQGVLYHLFTKRVKNKANIPRDQRIIKQLAVPKSRRQNILHAYHDSLLGGGHQGYERTLEAIRLKYYWPRMATQILDYVNSCDVCQKTKRNYGTQKAPLVNMPIENRFERWHMDFIGPINPSGTEGNKHILVLVDSFSRWCEAIPMKTQEATEVAHTLYREIITRYGAPKKLVSDRGQNFLSKVVQALSALFNIKRYHTSSYHPQTNSTCERLNSYIATQLKAYVAKNPSTWDKYIPGILMNYRKTPAMQSTGFSPFFLLFGSEMNCPIDTELVPTNAWPKNVKEHIKKLQDTHSEAHEIAKSNIQNAQKRNKTYYDRKTQEPNFKVGDTVLLTKFRQTPNTSQKLQRKKEDDTYYIIGLGSNYTYKLANTQDHKEYKGMVHANRMKLYKDPRDSLTPRAEENENQVQVRQNNRSTTEEAVSAPKQQEKKMQKVIRLKPRGGIPYYKVKYEDGSVSEWKISEQLPPTLLKEYHINYTLSGRKRKRKTPGKKN